MKEVCLVYLVYSVYLVCSIYLVYLVGSVCLVRIGSMSLMQSIQTMVHFVKRLIRTDL